VQWVLEMGLSSFSFWPLAGLMQMQGVWLPTMLWVSHGKVSAAVIYALFQYILCACMSSYLLWSRMFCFLNYL